MRMIRSAPKGKSAGQELLTGFLRRCCPTGRQDEPNLTLFVKYTELGSPTLSPDKDYRDKTLTVRHAETSDREDKRSESYLVMRQIEIDFTGHLVENIISG